VLLSVLPASARFAVALQPEVATARIGISAGVAIAQVPPGTDRRALEQRIPILFETADRLGVTIDSVSVGQGFFSEDGVVMSEHDLDLVVSGPPDNVNALAAILGQAWDQSLVFDWYAAADGSMATATILLPSGAVALTGPIYEQLVGELVDGGHVRYAGADSLIFVANTGDGPDAAFYARMTRAQQLFERVGVRVGPVQPGRAEMVTLDRATYDAYIARRIRGKAA